MYQQALKELWDDPEHKTPTPEEYLNNPQYAYATENWVKGTYYKYIRSNNFGLYMEYMLGLYREQNRIGMASQWKPES